MGVNYPEVIERMRWAGKLKNDSAVARAVGVTPQALSSCKKRGEMPSDLVLKFSNTFSLSIDWLITGEGEMYKTRSSPEASHGAGASEDPSRAFPVGRESGPVGFAVINAEEVQYVNRLLLILRSGQTGNAEAVKNTIDALFKNSADGDMAANSD